MEDINRDDPVKAAAGKVLKLLEEKKLRRKLDEQYKEYIIKRASVDADAYRRAFGSFLMRLDCDSMDELWDMFNPKKWKKDTNYRDLVRTAVLQAGFTQNSTGYNNIENIFPLTEKLNWRIVDEFLRINDEMEFYSANDEFTEFFVGSFESVYLARGLLLDEIRKQEIKRIFMILGGIFLVIILLALISL